MNLALGIAGIVLGLTACIGGLVAQVVGLRSPDRRELLTSSRGFALIAFLGAVVSVLAMQRALLTNDTTVRYVAEQSSSLTPFPFDVATMWGALEGSILLWALVLAGYTLAVAQRFRDRLRDPLVGWAMLVMFAVGIFFFALMLGPALPFQSFDPPPGFDGPGPNELLQNHLLMAFHPPMLYLGYVGFTVPFAFAIAALVTGRVGEGWLVETRRWTLFAWGFLTAGILLGAWWSYEVLGWGGYWAWDPVENASFLPWICGTAYIHSVMVQERRGLLRVWNLTLLCATFSLTILGTFLTRSGVVESVHAFSNSTIGPLLLSFFALIVVVSVGLIGWRGDRLRAPGRIDSPLSREGAFFANNLVFAVFAFVVLLGTVFPLIVEALNGDRISVGAPFFDRMAMPIGIVLLFLMAVAPVLPWRASNAEVLSQRLLWPAVGGVATLAFAVAVGARGFWPLLAFALGGFAGGSAVRQLVLATRRLGWRGLVGRTNGGMIVHLGVIVIAIALAASQSYLREGEFQLEEGQTARVAGHTMRYEGIRIVERDNRREVRARIVVDGDEVHEPRINQYLRTGREIGTPSVDVSPRGDVYLSLQRYPGDDDPTIGLRVVVQPLVSWLWVGGAMMCLGTVFAAFPGRRRDPLSPTSKPVEVAA
ncbi:MAG TPA: heme lyase CcmF/NrfE family subunit [Microthrixaceae bacterium]|nr:heme lyase CcmF/NrfE family subunit [Microthrixaceae bacterium]